MVLYVYIVYLSRFRVYMGTFNEREITFWQTPDHIPDEGDFRAQFSIKIEIKKIGKNYHRR